MPSAEIDAEFLALLSPEDQQIIAACAAFDPLAEDADLVATLDEFVLECPDI